MKPTFTLTYGLAYSIAMPPYEINGKQVELVNDAGTPINLSDFLGESAEGGLGRAELRAGNWF